MAQTVCVSLSILVPRLANHNSPLLVPDLDMFHLHEEF
jgi:hypothetical protein